MLGTAEKGYVDIQISVETPGGHSSAPPDFTAIDCLAKIITSVNENQFHSQLTDRNPVMKYLALAARYGKDMSDELRDAIFDPEKIGVVLGYLEADVEMRALVRTSIAVDVVRGGEKGMFSGNPLVFEISYFYIKNPDTSHFLQHRVCPNGLGIALVEPSDLEMEIRVLVIIKHSGNDQVLG